MGKKSILSMTLTIGLALSATAQDATDASSAIEATLQDDAQQLRGQSVDFQRSYYQARLTAAQAALAVLQASPGQTDDAAAGQHTREERERQREVEQQLRRQIRDQRRIVTDSEVALRRLGS
jgi:hypothetical protein